MTLDDIRRAQVVFTRDQVPPSVASDVALLRGATRLAATFGPDIVYLATDAIEEGGVIMPPEVYDALLLEVVVKGEAAA